MNIEAAALKTLKLAHTHAAQGRVREIPGLSLSHVEDMWARWPVDGSPTKRCRWLGWMQAAVVAMTEGRASLEEMKAINLACAQDPAPDLTSPEAREGAILAWGAVLALIDAGASLDGIGLIARENMVALRGESV
jgi:hypothetical protein